MDGTDARIKADHIVIDIEPAPKPLAETTQVIKFHNVASLPQTIQGWLLVVFFGLELLTKTVAVVQSFSVPCNSTLPR